MFWYILAGLPNSAQTFAIDQTAEHPFTWRMPIISESYLSLRPSFLVQTNPVKLHTEVVLIWSQTCHLHIASIGG